MYQFSFKFIFSIDSLNKKKYVKIEQLFQMHEKFPLETTMPMPQTSFVQCNEYDNINYRFVLFKYYCYETNSAFYVFFFRVILLHAYL